MFAGESGGLSEEERSRVVTRRSVLGSSAVGITLLALPSAAAAASEAESLATFSCSGQWASIPFLAQGEAGIVGVATVRAIENTGVQGNTSTTYLHQSNDRIRTVLTFSPALPATNTLRVQARNHADGVSETYTLTFKLGGNVVSTDTIVNVDTVKTYSFSFDRLEIDYTHPTPAGPGTYGSYLELAIPCE